MLKRIALFLCITLITLPAYSVNEPIELKILNAQKKIVNPGDNVNVIVEVINTSSTVKTVQLETPSNNLNYRLLGDYSSITVERNSTLKKIIGIKISNNLAAGDSTITILGKEKESQNVFGNINIPILINQTFEFSLSKLKSPVYVLSGEDIRINYLIQNLSNHAIKIKTSTLNGSENQVSEIALDRDSSIQLTKVIKTEKKVQGYSTRSVIFIAQIVDKPETENSIYTPIDVFPSEIIKFDKYERFPVSITTIMATSNRSNQLIYSGMYDILGQGTLGKNLDKTLDFHLRGPDRTGNPLFGMNKEYYLKYKTPTFSTNIGDYSFGLSELTESSRSGLGVELKTSLKKLTLSGYYVLPRYYPLIKNVIAVSMGFNINPKNNIYVGILTKSDTLNTKNMLYSISGKISPFSWLSSENEVAFGQDLLHLTKAYKTAIQLNINGISTHLVYLYADPNFQGYVKNSARFNFGTSFQLKKLTLSVNYDMNSSNMALDTLYGNMPINNSISVNAGYRINSQHTVNISYNDISIKDRSANPLFDYTRKGGRFILQNTFNYLTISMLGDVGKMLNRLGNSGGEESLTYSGTVSSFYLYKRIFTANVFSSIQGGSEKNVTGSKQLYYGGGGAINLKSYFSASFQYTSNYEWKYYTSDRNLLSLSLNAHINAKNELNLTGSYNLIKNTLDQKEYNVQLRYVYKLNMPIGLKKNLGSISGKIINHGIPRVNDIRLNLNGIVTMSNKEGDFKFPAVPIGTHILSVDASNLGINTMIERTGPIQIMVEPSKVTHYELPMTTSGKISGRIMVEEDERSSQKGYIPVKESIDKLIVEASDGTQISRIYTDKEGAFGFDDLLPGKWQIKIYPNGLPQGFSLVTSIFNINLTSGKHEFLEVKIQKKARQIQFQKN